MLEEQIEKQQRFLCFALQGGFEETTRRRDHVATPHHVCATLKCINASVRLGTRLAWFVCLPFFLFVCLLYERWFLKDILVLQHTLSFYLKKNNFANAFAFFFFFQLPLLTSFFDGRVGATLLINVSFGRSVFLWTSRWKDSPTSTQPIIVGPFVEFGQETNWKLRPEELVALKILIVIPPSAVTHIHTECLTVSHPCRQTHFSRSRVQSRDLAIAFKSSLVVFSPYFGGSDLLLYLFELNFFFPHTQELNDSSHRRHLCLSVTASICFQAFRRMESYTHNTHTPRSRSPPPSARIWRLSDAVCLACSTAEQC